MFEKISPPVEAVPAPAVGKRRGVVRQILHRVAEARVKRSQHEESPTIVSLQQPPSD